jgi:hypothetical protein
VYRTVVAGAWQHLGELTERSDTLAEYIYGHNKFLAWTAELLY